MNTVLRWSLFSNAKSQGQKINISEKTDEITYELRNYRKYLVASKEASVFGSAKNTFDDISKLSIFMK